LLLYFKDIGKLVVIHGKLVVRSILGVNGKLG